jgi:tetratricopeptide (TPR) repeat protein
MGGMTKPGLAGALVAAAWLVAAPQAPAQATPELPEAAPPAPQAIPAPEPAPQTPPTAENKADADAKLDQLLTELAQPGRKDWERVQAQITRIWSHSGSPAMDLLLSRGNDALAAENYPLAVEHFSALIDHAPDFAEGWNGRATAYFMLGEYSLSIADVEHVLVLNPRHFGALAGLGFMLEQLDEPRMALRAFEAAQKLNPNQPNVNDAVSRLEKMTGDAEL